MKENSIPGIVAIGASLGKKHVTNRDIGELLDAHRNGDNPNISEKLKERLRKAVDRMLSPVGTNSRYWADGNQSTSDLACEAAEEALQMAGISPRELRAITVGTMSQDYLGVPVAPAVQYKLEARDNIPAKDIQAACAGFLYVLHDVYKDLTSDLGKGGPQLGVGAEILSRHIHPSHGETFGLFGDAAGAFVADLVVDNQKLSSKIAFHFGADGQYQEDLYIPGGGTKYPTTQETLNQGMHCLQMNGKIIEEQAIRRMAESTEAVMEAADLKTGDVSLFIPHQANKKIILEVARLLNFPTEKVYINIQRYGNTSAASIPLAMKDAYLEGKLVPDEMILLASLGAGLSFGAAAIPTTGLPKRSMAQVIQARIISVLPPR